MLLLHCNCQTPLTISAKQKKVPQSVSDLDGMTCRANAGPPTMLVEALGMTPKACTINDLYSNLERQELDAALTDWHGISSFKIDEVASAFFDEDFGTSCYFLLMNQSAYEALSPQARAVLDEAAVESIPETSHWDDVQDAVKAKLEEKGMILHFPDDEQAALAEAERSVTDAWISKTDNGQEIYDTYIALLEKNEDE